MECTSQWISVLENTSEVVVEGTSCAETTTGGYTFTTYSKEKICDLAKQHLHYLNDLFPETSDEWTKKQWETWFLNLMKFREPLRANAIRRFGIRSAISTPTTFGQVSITPKLKAK